MGSWADQITLKIANVVAYFAFLGSNVYILVKSEGVYLSGRETYFTPEPYAFVIWPFIHLLLFGYITYQFTDNGKKTIIDVIGWNFPVMAVLSAIYINIWAKGHYILAWIFMHIIPSLVSGVPDAVRESNSSGSVHDELWVRLPFSVYYGWMGILYLVNGFEAFGVDASTDPAGVFTKMFVIWALWALTLRVAAVAVRAFLPRQSNLTDTGESIAIIWGLFAIFQHQHSSALIHWVTLEFAVISLLFVLLSLFARMFARGSLNVANDEERAPLVSGN